MSGRLRAARERGQRGERKGRRGGIPERSTALLTRQLRLELWSSSLCALTDSARYPALSHSTPTPFHSHSHSHLPTLDNVQVALSLHLTQAPLPFLRLDCLPPTPSSDIASTMSGEIGIAKYVCCERDNTMREDALTPSQPA